MSTTTENYNLVKPELTDVADITAMNENWDKIDEALNTTDTEIGDLSKLSTTGKANLVNAINELKNRLVFYPNSTLNIETGVASADNKQMYYLIKANDGTKYRIDITPTLKRYRVIDGDGNVLADIVEDLTKLNTTDKTSLVNAINELFATTPISRGGTGATTAEQARLNLGLGNVPNVATNDQTPTYSDTTTLQTLASGEKLNVAFQKIKCAITNLINHLANKSNPHGVTASQAGALPTTGGALSGALTVIDNFNVNKTYDSLEYKTYLRPVNYSIGNNGEYSTGLIHYKGDQNNAQLMFNKDGVMLRDNVNAKAYKLYGQHNKPTPEEIGAVSRAEWEANLLANASVEPKGV